MRLAELCGRSPGGLRNQRCKPPDCVTLIGPAGRDPTASLRRCSTAWQVSSPRGSISTTNSPMRAPVGTPISALGYFFHHLRICASSVVARHRPPVCGTVLPYASLSAPATSGLLDLRLPAGVSGVSWVGLHGSTV